MTTTKNEGIRAILIVRTMLALSCLGTAAAGASSRRILPRAATSSLPALFATPPLLGHHHRPRLSNHRKCFSATNEVHSGTPDASSLAPAALEDDEGGRNGEEGEEGASGDGNDGEGLRYVPPWSTPQKKFSNSRFRQHVNPLARRYQMHTDLPENWPRSVFDDVDLPLYLDVGCGKGGFLLELVGRRHGNGDASRGERFEGISDDSYMARTKDIFGKGEEGDSDDSTSEWLPPRMNYLGLEIRPGVSQYARSRAEKRGLGGILSFVGCNANVDLGRLLALYRESSSSDGEETGEGGGLNRRPAFVSIQFPDPHFKKAHSKRRIVTPALVTTLAEFMTEGDAVFLQSDIKDALEAMRERFVEEEGDGLDYFEEWSDPNRGARGGDSISEEEYGMDNPLGIPTEREVSVLKKGLPIYRTLFRRNGVGFGS